MNNDNLKPVFYIIAHPDDWQIFFGHQVLVDSNITGVKVVFIHMTSGDADPALGKYWILREQGAVHSCQLLTSGGDPVPSTTSFKEHNFTKYYCGNTVSYFLRLKEVDFNNVLTCTSSKIRTSDGNSEYNGLADINASLQFIVKTELHQGDINGIWINTHEYKIFDHPGHVNTGQIVNDLFQEFNLSFFIGYVLLDRSPFILDDKIFNLKRSLLLAYTNKIFEETQKTGSPIDDYVANQEQYDAWLKRFSTRIVNSSKIS